MRGEFVIACFARALLLGLMLCGSAMAKDAPQVAASAEDAAIALQLHLKKLEKSGRHPDYAAAPASDLFQRSFDVALIASLSSPRADDALWLINWVRTAHKAKKSILLFGSKWPSDKFSAADRLLTLRNLQEYGDQYAAAENFVLRLAAHTEVARSLAIHRLTPKQRT